MTDNTSAMSTTIPAIPPKYNSEDARSRVNQARLASLAPDQVTPAYLLTLSTEIRNWHTEVMDEIAKRDVFLSICENCGREFAQAGADPAACSAECLERINEDTAAADQLDEKEGGK